ncbi:hypothetical protein [Halarchaeum salinum]|uniref:Uncharacterized protein n=1 Tax=Halarchaeum salinum TaxID=489912 RepID=A0AAV3S8T2_9EURY
MPDSKQRQSGAQTRNDWSPQTFDHQSSGMNYDSHPTGDLLSALNESGAPTDAKRLFGSELNQDHILGKLNEDELWYRRFELEINLDLLLASAPPETSIWQGPRREEVDLGGKPWPFSASELHEARDTRDAAYARATRSRDGWQQKLLAEQQSERRIVEERDEGSEGLLSKLVG